MDPLSEVFHIGPHCRSTSGQQKKIEGFVVLQTKNVLDFNDFSADILDDPSELIGKGVSFQLVSASEIDSRGSGCGKFGEKALLQNWVSTISTKLDFYKTRMAETERNERDRVYDYDFYNDLRDPDKSVELSRTVLRGSQQFPYPRRGRTGRPPTKTDPATKSRLPLEMSLDRFPEMNVFGHLKMSDFLAYALKSVVQFLIRGLQSLFDPTLNEFDSFEDMKKLYSGGIKLRDNPILDAIRGLIPLELIKEFLRTGREKLLKYPLPQVISTGEFAWRTDEEFACQMLAGVDPVVIQRLQVISKELRPPCHYQYTEPRLIF